MTTVEPMKIAGWANYVDGPGHYRIGVPMAGLAQSGHVVTAQVGQDFVLSRPELPQCPDLDVVVVQRVEEPFPTGVWRDMADLPGRSFALVFDIDDDLWNVDPANPHADFYNNAEMRERIATNVSLADIVTVPTDHLAEVVRSYNSRVHVLPNCIDSSLLRHERPKRDRLTVGWAGGRSHRADFASVQKELTSFFRRHADVDAHFIGANHGDLVGRRDARYTLGSNDLSEYHRMFDFDIALAPLAYKSFNRSKSDVKFLEYAALGIPVVASDFGPYAASIEHGVTGFLARHPHEWPKYLGQLVNDEALRSEIGANAKAWAATRTIQANSWRWQDAYLSAAGK